VSKKLRAKANAVFDRVLDITAFLGGALLVFLILSVCWEVVLRYFFNKPTSWVVEVSGYIVLWVPFLVSAWVLRKGSHIRMDLLISGLKPKGQAILNTITFSIAALICFIITWYGVKVVIDLYQTGFITQTFLRIYKWPIIAIIPISTSLLFLEFLRKITNALSGWKHPEGNDKMPPDTLQNQR
jgi:TRAP-type C4-dicarboxylate transport system permease small subunit